MCSFRAYLTNWLDATSFAPETKLQTWISTFGWYHSPESLENVTATQISKDNITNSRVLHPPIDLFLENYFGIKKYLLASLSDELLIVKTERTWPICLAWYCLILLFSHLEQRQYISLIWFGFYLCSYLQFWIIISKQQTIVLWLQRGRKIILP